MKFTGFYEVHPPAGGETEMLTTVSYVETDDLIERIRARLADVKPGSHIRIDLIAWDGEQ